MGAVPYPGGTTFRVWAPDATQAFVAGDWNGWDATASELAAEGHGLFSADVAGALAGQQYELVLRSGAEVLHRADPRAQRMTGADGRAVIVDHGAYSWTSTAYRTPSFDDQVIYELHLGTFADTAGPGTGTFQSAIGKLDHLAALGVSMIEILPPNEFPGGYSWGYNPSFPSAPESSYGTPDDAKAFVEAAHARGMGVIVDVVHNHYGPDQLSLWCFDGPCFGAGGIYFYADWRRETGFGPRPDFGRAEVRDFVLDSALTWLRDYRADGLRWDSTVNIRRAGGTDLPDGWKLLQRMNDRVDREQPWKIMIAEDLQNDDWVTRPTGSGGAGFDSQWDPDFYYPMKDALVAASDGARDMGRVAYAIGHGYNGVATHRVLFTENHDQVAPQNGGMRMTEAIWPGHGDSVWARKRSSLGAAVALTSPGIPMLFQGQEFADTTPFPFGRDRGIDWSKADTNAGILRLYQDLVHLRRNAAGTTAGLRGNNTNIFHVNDADKVLAWHRWDRGGPGDDVVVVANFSSRAFAAYDLGLPRGGTWKVRFNGDWKGYAADFAGTPSNDLGARPEPRDGLSFTGTVGVGPYSVVVLSQ
jgi:1,4-alpha-glucan branching enzyme